MHMKYLHRRLELAEAADADFVKVDIEEFASLLAAVPLSEKREINITEELVDITDMDVDIDRLIFDWELWFNVDEYFGTNTWKSSEKWINFYTYWSPEDGVTATYHIDGEDEYLSFDWYLTSEEKRFFFKKMETYCKKSSGKTLYEFWNETSK